MTPNTGCCEVILSGGSAILLIPDHCETKLSNARKPTRTKRIRMLLSQTSAVHDFPMNRVRLQSRDVMFLVSYYNKSLRQLNNLFRDLGFVPGGWCVLPCLSKEHNPELSLGFLLQLGNLFVCTSMSRAGMDFFVGQSK